MCAFCGEALAASATAGIASLEGKVYNSAYYSNLSASYYQLQRYTDCVETATKALAMFDPKDNSPASVLGRAIAENNIACGLWKLGKPQEAVEHELIACALAPGNAQYKTSLDTFNAEAKQAQRTAPPRPVHARR
jgi:tetratricopeptide (TPR) repeat protein